MRPRTLLLLLAACAAAACAKQGYPSGGPRDTAPPTARQAKPANESRRFSDTKFYIEFDEYVVLKDAANNVLISPPMAQKPEITTKGKGVQVKIKDTLQPNTTYLFQFKNAIADFTEGNLLESFDYVFSTGEGMDTLMLGGRVLDARTGKPRKDQVTVMAYAREGCTSDTMARHLQPLYVTRCDKEGRFGFRYISAGDYRLVAVEDANHDLRQGPAEAVGWDLGYTSATDSLDSASAVLLRMADPAPSRQRTLSAAFTRKGHGVIVTALPMQAPSIGGMPVVTRLNDRRDSLRFWCTDPERDTATVTFADDGFLDTLSLRLQRAKKGRGRKSAEAEPLLSAPCAGTGGHYDRMTLAFLNPSAPLGGTPRAEVTDLDADLTTTAPLRMAPDSLSATLDTLLVAGRSYRIRIADSLFADLYGHHNDSLRFDAKPRDYAILTLHIDNPASLPLLVELLDARDTLVAHQPLQGAGTVRFDHLASGTYRVRAVVDTDRDGRWTTADYAAGRQPEPTLYMQKDLSLREKWEVEERWTVQQP